MPSDLRGFQKWLSTLPSTNTQLFAGICMALLSVLTLLACLVLAIPLQEGVVDSVLLFIVAWITGGVAQFGVKRVTTKPEIIAAMAAAEGQPVRTITTETTQTTTEAAPTSAVPASPS